MTHLNKFKFDKRKGYFKQIKKRVKCNPQIKKEFGKLDIPTLHNHNFSLDLKLWKVTQTSK